MTEKNPLKMDHVNLLNCNVFLTDSYEYFKGILKENKKKFRKII